MAWFGVVSDLTFAIFDAFSDELAQAHLAEKCRRVDGEPETC